MTAALQRKRKAALDIRTPFGAKFLSSLSVAGNLEQKDKCRLEHYRALDLGLCPTDVQSRSEKFLSILIHFLKLLLVPTILRPVEQVQCIVVCW